VQGERIFFLESELYFARSRLSALGIPSPPDNKN
jgi:hypothetical protein